LPSGSWIVGHFSKEILEQLEKSSEQVREADDGIKPGVSAVNPGKPVRNERLVREADDGPWQKSALDHASKKKTIRRWQLIYRPSPASRARKFICFLSRGSLRSPRALCRRPLRGLVQSFLFKLTHYRRHLRRFGHGSLLKEATLPETTIVRAVNGWVRENKSLEVTL
jgi:hypothetical protein